MAATAFSRCLRVCNRFRAVGAGCAFPTVRTYVEPDGGGSREFLWGGTTIETLVLCTIDTAATASAFSRVSGFAHIELHQTCSYSSTSSGCKISSYLYSTILIVRQISYHVLPLMRLPSSNLMDYRATHVRRWSGKGLCAGVWCRARSFAWLQLLELAPAFPPSMVPVA